MEAEESHIWSLIARKFSGEATESECEELKVLLRTQPSWQYTYELLCHWWEQQNKAYSGQEARVSLTRMKEKAGIYHFKPETGSPGFLDADRPAGLKEKRFPRRIIAVTAALLLLICSGLYFWLPLRTRNPPENGHTSYSRLSEISTHYGSKSKATLPDGTLVWLNAGTKLTYHNDRFSKKVREVSITGEAFFNVTHDADHPFIIHAGKINIKVLGTTLDVKSYPEDNTSETTLIRGAIEVSFADQPEKKVRLKPHQKLVVYKDDQMVARSLNISQKEEVQGYRVSPVTLIPEDSTVVETSWVQNKLAFRSEKFVDLAQQMQRWYNVRINFSGSKVKQYRFTGIFVNESLEEALQALQITAPFRYRIEQNEVFISNIP